MKRIQAVEGQRLVCTPHEERLAKQALNRLQRSLRPRFAFYDERDGHIRPRNLVGTVRLDTRTVLDVTPKTEPGTDWVGAVIDLMLPSRIAVSGSREGARSRQRKNLTDAIAVIYADRLEAALRTEGPLELIERHDLLSNTLRGMLDVTRWTRTSILTPHRFPVSVSRLTSDNPFSSVMSFCAEVLARGTKDAATGSRLRSLSQTMRPGRPPVPSINPSDARRELPPQWAGYADVWAVAAALISRSTLLGRQGAMAAFDVAVESWPLLEELVQRTIDTTALLAAEENLDWARGRRRARPLLVRGDPAAVEEDARDVVPDGVLLENGATRAVFEAKYSRLGGGAAPRAHVFQVLATAAASGARDAVLIYPEKRKPVAFDVLGHHGTPARLIVQGLDLFAYRPDDQSEAKELLECLKADRRGG